MSNNYLIYGAGGHTRVLFDLIYSLEEESTVIGLFNDSSEHKELNKISISSYDAHAHPDIPLVIGIGASKVRKILTEKVKHSFATLIHPKAYVAKGVEIGEGTVVLSGAVIQAGAKIGKHVIINSNVTIDHDAVVEDYVTTYPGVYIGAEAVISEGTTINPNAVIMRFMKTAEFSEVAPGQIISK